MNNLLPWLVLTVYIFISGCSTKEKKKSKEVFKVINPILIDTTYYKEYVADIHAVKNVEIRARVQGQIERILIDEGQYVKTGQTLFTISSHAYKEDLTKARAQLKNAIAEAKAAELDVMNARKLVESKIISVTEMEMAESKLDALKAKIEEAHSHEATAQMKLSYTQIKAPFDGIIDKIPLKMGSLIDEGTLLTTISDNKEVFAYFNVSENEYLDFVQNPKETSDKNEVTLILSNSKEHLQKGKVEIIQGEINKATGNISFRARFPNPNKILKHGSSGKVRLKKSLESALVIPQKSTFEVQDKMYVYVIDGKNIVRTKSIVVKLRIPHLYVIEYGLNSEDKVIYEGIQNVKEGESINPELIPAKQIIAELSQQ